jgi:magnesium chelatase family protein
VQRYRGKISGPLLDRIDLHVEVSRPARTVINGNGPQPEDSASVRERVVAARERQLRRSGLPNAQLGSAGVREICSLEPSLEDFLDSVAETMCLSPRACQRILKVARTIADLAASAAIEDEHLAEAISCRGIDCGNVQG